MKLSKSEMTIKVSRKFSVWEMESTRHTRFNFNLRGDAARARGDGVNTGVNDITVGTKQAARSQTYQVVNTNLR